MPNSESIIMILYDYFLKIYQLDLSFTFDFQRKKHYLIYTIELKVV